MALRWYTVVVDSHDVASLARWWAETLDFAIVYEAEGEATIIPKHMSVDPIEDAQTWMHQAQGLVFVPVPEGKTVKNRLHIDLAPHATQDRDAEIAALLDRGATLADVGQGDDVGWTVMRGGNERSHCLDMSHLRCSFLVSLDPKPRVAQNRVIW